MCSTAERLSPAQVANLYYFNPDNVSLTTVAPEPASLALLGLGSLALLARRRDKKRDPCRSALV